MKKVVALGDSITYGYPYTPDVSWVEQLRKATGWQVHNAGVSGDTFQDMYLRLEKDVLIHEPELVILMGGTNDVYVGLTQPQIQGSFLAIMDILKAKGIKVVIGLPLPVDDRTEGPLKKWRTWLKGYSAQEGIPLLDFHQDFVDEAGQMKTELILDGCHPRVQGYEIMGKRAVSTVDSW